MTEIADPKAVRERALKSLAVPVGLANPLWLCFAAAASAGAAWWLMTRLATPFNAEAMFGSAAPAKKAPAKSVDAPKPAAKAAPPVDERTPETTPVALEVALEVAPAIVEAMTAPLEAALEAANESVEIEAVAAEETVKEAETQDDLTRLVGVGPRTAAALMERGVTRFAHLAAWTEEQMAEFDAELNLKGRSVRDAWRVQAKRLATEA
jgi:predicted flap endonuclease-1-like 5' DNA nuclease